MKVSYKNMLLGYRGKQDGMIYYIDKRTGQTLARKAFTFTNHPGQAPFAAAQKQIYALQPAEAYKHQLLDYCMSYNRLPEAECKQLFSWPQVYCKLMWAMQKTNPDTISLANITREQIYTENMPCKTLKAAIDAGLLPQVEGYERFNAEM